ncbi:MAG TPA: DUF1801 domain-containing protein [Candidatus Levybacteria bacterium]|nr:DUF1801 domain-containing protein [Candidatus Levybacteria bacterium]
MTNYLVKSVDEYISAAPKEARAHLEEIRKAVVSAAPKAEEQIGYGKPYYKYHTWVVGFDALKRHISFEIWNGLSDEDRIVLKEKGYKTGSVTFQIRYDQKVPTAVIKKLVQRQMKLNELKSKNKKK